MRAFGTFPRQFGFLALRVALAAAAVFALTAVALTAIDGRQDQQPASAKARPGSLVVDSAGRIRAAQAAIRQRPRDTRGYVELGRALTQRGRETANPAYYTRSDAAYDAALRIDSGDYDALVGRGSVQLGLHEFAAALRTGRRAHRTAPHANGVFPVIADAQIELGRYADASRTLQRWVDRDPGYASYARVSYFRELHGDLHGAVAAMRSAIKTGARAPENVAFAQVLIGDLELLRGRIAAARRAYGAALSAVVGYAPATGGLARVAIATGDDDRAAVLLRRAAARVPSPPQLLELAEIAYAEGQRAQAGDYVADARGLLMAERRVGIRNDAELAVLEADFGNRKTALRWARSAWKHAPSVEGADALGWALTRTGHPRQGLAYARRALRLGSPDPRLSYHAGIAARDAGRKDLAVRYLRRAVARTRFSALLAPRAKRIVENLTAQRR